jgi:hypothetical protein
MLATAPAPDKPCAHCGGEPDWRAEHLAMLRELAELNMRLARAVVAQAEEAAERRAEPDSEPAPREPDPSLALSRLGRAVRLTLAMEARVRGQADGVADTANAETTRQDELADKGTDRAATIDSNRAFITETLEEAVELAPRESLQARDTPDREGLLEDLLDRIDGLSDDILFDVPEGVLIERLCAEFGLDPDPDTIADRDEDKLWRGWTLPPLDPAPHEPADQEQALELSS